jgi:peroxiredoxin
VSASLLGVGTEAPAFSASANDGRTYTLASLLEQGAVALFLYPGNNTPG